MVSLLTLNSSLDRLFFVLDAFLEFDDSVLSVFLFLLNVFHELVKDVLGLEFFLLGASMLGQFSFKDLLLGLKRDFLFGRTNAGSDEVLLHALEHVSVRRLSHHLFVNFGVRLLKSVLELLLTGLHLVDGSFGVDFLLFKSPYFLVYLLKVKFLLVDHFVGIVVLLLNLRELDGNFTDFLSIVLLSGSIVGRVEEGVSLNEASRSVVNFKLFSHDLLKVA